LRDQIATPVTDSTATPTPTPINATPIRQGRPQTSAMCSADIHSVNVFAPDWPRGRTSFIRRPVSLSKIASERPPLSRMSAEVVKM